MQHSELKDEVENNRLIISVPMRLTVRLLQCEAMATDNEATTRNRAFEARAGKAAKAYGRSQDGVIAGTAAGIADHMGIAFV
jgi:hypothetical protein